VRTLGGRHNNPATKLRKAEQLLHVRKEARIGGPSGIFHIRFHHAVGDCGCGFDSISMVATAVRNPAHLGLWRFYRRASIGLDLNRVSMTAGAPD
jgi:hypothetical protein